MKFQLFILHILAFSALIVSTSSKQHPLHPHDHDKDELSSNKGKGHKNWEENESHKDSSNELTPNLQKQEQSINRRNKNLRTVDDDQNNSLNLELQNHSNLINFQVGNQTNYTQTSKSSNNSGFQTQKQNSTLNNQGTLKNQNDTQNTQNIQEINSNEGLLNNSNNNSSQNDSSQIFNAKDFRKLGYDPDLLTKEEKDEIEDYYLMKANLPEFENIIDKHFEASKNDIEIPSLFLEETIPNKSKNQFKNLIKQYAIDAADELFLIYPELLDDESKGETIDYINKIMKEVFADKLMYEALLQLLQMKEDIIYLAKNINAKMSSQNMELGKNLSKEIRSSLEDSTRNINFFIKILVENIEHGYLIDRKSDWKKLRQMLEISDLNN